MCCGGVSGQTSQKPWIDGDGSTVTGGARRQEGKAIAEEAVQGEYSMQASLHSLPISHPPLPTVSHLGPSSIHPDGGFIFVFVCLLIHASSYSGHRRGFRSTTECKSPQRLIHFHLSLVDIQLLSTFPSVSHSQAMSFFSGYGIRPAVARLAWLQHMHVKHNIYLSPPTHLSHPQDILPFLQVAPSLPALTLAPHRASSKSEVVATGSFPMEWEAAGASLIELGRM